MGLPAAESCHDNIGHNELSLSDHVDAAMNKANRLVGLIRRSYEYLDRDSLVQLYKALVRLHLEYGHVIWPLCFKTDLNKVENVQRRMTKLIQQIRDLEYPERLDPDTKATVHS